MKKVLMFVAGVVFVASLSSCKKEYSCKCTFTGGELTYDIKATKKDAEAACEAYVVSGWSCDLSKK